MKWKLPVVQLFMAIISCLLLQPFQVNCQEMDIRDLINKILHKKADSGHLSKKPALAILPSLSYNPSLGFLIGAKATAGRQFGDPTTTAYSLFGLEAFITSKEILSIQARHNLFTKSNRYNFQGNWQVAKYAVIDYGIGSERPQQKTGFIVNAYSTKNSDSAFPIKYNYLRLHETVYRRIAPHLFAGAGINVNVHTRINDIKLDDSMLTPHQVYSVVKGFNPVQYTTNGISLALQYNTREHPSRSYGGIYADAAVLFNQQWLGSTMNSVQLQLDFRKYWSLSKKRPAHVLAFWHLANYQLSGAIPYLQLPGTATDTYNRSGRAYTIGYFKGPSFAYFETEYRFPIFKSGLLSGVFFINEQTVSNARNAQLFANWQTGVGAGLRILFQKESRTTMCIDFGHGRFGSSGIFFGLNEVF